MQGFNHIAGGIAFTGIFASFTDVNIFKKPEYLAATVFFALFPDIDHTKSGIGKGFYPLAQWINRAYGHRTITHSLVFYLAILLVVGGAEMFFGLGTDFTKITAFALASHLIFDMCTKAGIPLFYPFSKRPCVLPGNPNLRLSTSDMRSETIIFFGFLTLTLTCLPLMSQGFWTTYNKAFLTFDHVQREALRSPDMLEVVYKQKNFPASRGILVDITNAKMILWDGKKFVEVARGGADFLDFRRTGRMMKIDQVSLFNVSPDSLKSWLSYPLISLQMQSSQEIKYYEGAVLKSSKEINLSYQKDFSFFMETLDPTEDNLRLEMLEAELQIEQIRQQKVKNEWSRIKAALQYIVLNYANVSDYEKGKMIDEKKRLEADLMQIAGQQEDKTDVLRLQISHQKERMNSDSNTLNANLRIWKY